MILDQELLVKNNPSKFKFLAKALLFTTISLTWGEPWVSADLDKCEKPIQKLSNIFFVPTF